jgi:hypothetical protein
VLSHMSQESFWVLSWQASPFSESYGKFYGRPESSSAVSLPTSRRDVSARSFACDGPPVECTMHVIEL